MLYVEPFHLLSKVPSFYIYLSSKNNSKYMTNFVINSYQRKRISIMQEEENITKSFV